MIKATLEMNDRGFTPELSIFATNPKDQERTHFPTRGWSIPTMARRVRVS